jgi:hypothetical protein
MTCLHGGGTYAIEQRVQLRLAFSLILARIQPMAGRRSYHSLSFTPSKALVSEIVHLKNPK